jgi:hypothetical protein
MLWPSAPSTPMDAMLHFKVGYVSTRNEGANHDETTDCNPENTGCMHFSLNGSLLTPAGPL